MFISLLACFSFARYTSDTNWDSINTYCSSLSDDTVNVIDNKNGLYMSQGKYAFCTQGIAKDITISVDISQEAFYMSTKIHKVALTDDVTSIGKGAFYGCTNLELSLQFKNTLKTINEGAFEGCTSLSENIIFHGGSIEKDAFRDCTGITGSLTLTPATGVTQQSIGESSFEGTRISTFNPGTVLKSIGNLAFYSTPLACDLSFNNELTNIGEGAFMNTGITKLTFTTRTNLLTIGKHAFENVPLTNQGTTLTIPDQCNSLGEYAFARAGNVRTGTGFTGTAYISKKILSIPKYLFYNSTITKVTSEGGNTNENSFYKHVNTIGAHAFDNSGLSGKLNLGLYMKKIDPYAFKSTSISGQIDWYDSLETIDDFAFYDCRGISGPITIFDTLVKIGDCAFEGTGISGAATIRSELNLGERAFVGTQLTELKIYKDVPESAFEGITTLTNVYFESTTSTPIKINKNSFKDCHISSILNFEKVQIETDAFLNARFTNSAASAVVFFNLSSVDSYAFRNFQITNCLMNFTDTQIGNSAFETLNGQPRVVFSHVIYNDGTGSPDNGNHAIGSHAFYNTRIQTNLDIPEHVNYIGPYAFAYCTGLTGSLSINSSNICNHAFYSSGFTGSLTLGDNVGCLNALITGSSIVCGNSEALTFKGCKFNQVILNNSGSIPIRAFYQMKYISSRLYIPQTITSIGREAFAGCTGITSLEFEASPNPTKKDVNDQVVSNQLTINQAAFMGCTGITSSLVINRALSNSEIPSYAFYECTKIPSLTFETKLRTINQYAFYNCNSLKTISFPIELTTIGYMSFAECTSLSGPLVIPQSSSIGSGAFMNCAGLTGNLDLSSTLYIGSSAFYGCTGFDGILTLYNPVIPETHDPQPYIGSDAFYGCRNLKGSLHLESFDQIDSRAFYECSGLDGNLTLPYLTTIKEYTFYGCSGLTGPLVLTASTIEKYAFYGCSRLSGHFELPDSISSIGECAFAGCSGLTGPLEFPGTINFIGKSAFRGCSGFSDHLSIQVGGQNNNNALRIEERAFEDCSGFKNGYLSIYVNNDETIDHRSFSSNNYDSKPHYRYPYFLRIQNEAFEGTKFKNIYYNGRFQPDCDYDIGISSIKGIHTSANYANKTFCGNPIHSSKLSGGAIAGIVIACIVVVAVIVVLIVFLILKNKKNKDNSEGEVEMNNEP